MGKNKKPKPASFPPAAAKKLMQQDKNPLLTPLLFLTAITVICFFPMLKNNFINWDDDFYVLNNSLLQGPDWKGIFTKDIASNYHPLTILTLALNYAISGTEAWSYLLLNLALHIINVILVFKFIYSISGSKEWVAFFTALVFAIHPMHVESVAWVSERKDVLYTLFFLLSLMQYWQFLQTEKKKSLLYCFIFFILSLLSKPAAIVLPIVLFLLDYWKGRSFNKKMIVEKTPFFLMAGLFAVITLSLQSSTAIISLEEQPLWARVFYACYGLMIYFTRFFIPYPLSGYHPYPPHNDLGLAIYVSPLFAMALAVALWFLRKNKTFVFGILFYAVNLLLVLQIITIGSTVISERYTYIPYIGLAFIAGMWLDPFITRKSLKWAVPAAIILIFGYLGFQRTYTWKDSEAFWSDVIARFPAAPLPRNQRAIFYASTAEKTTDKAAANDLLQNALEDYNVMIQSKPNLAVALQNRQRIYLDMERYEEALADAKDLIKLEPANHTAFYTIGVVYMHRDKYDTAVLALNKSVSLNANYADAWNMLGSILMRKYQQFDPALMDFNKAISIEPRGLYYANRSVCYYNMKNIEMARADAIIALKKNVMIPDDYQHALNIK